MIILPTNAELEILEVLWRTGPSTVRTVNDKLNEQTRAVQYTSTLKLMQIMVDKGMLSRDESAMKHVYTAIVEEQETKGEMLGKFVNTIFNGSASKLMMQLLANKETSPEELTTIKNMLNDLEEDL